MREVVSEEDQITMLIGLDQIERALQATADLAKSTASLAQRSGTKANKLFKDI